MVPAETIPKDVASPVFGTYEDYQPRTAFFEKHAEIIVSLIRQGFTYEAIAQKAGISTGALTGGLHRLGINRRNLNISNIGKRIEAGGAVHLVWRSDQDAHIQRGHACGFPVHGVAATVNRSVTAVLARAKCLGLGGWIYIECPRRRLSLAKAYDAKIKSDKSAKEQDLL